MRIGRRYDFLLVNCMLCAVLHFMRNKLYIIERGLRTTG